MTPSTLIVTLPSAPTVPVPIVFLPLSLSVTVLPAVPGPALTLTSLPFTPATPVKSVSIVGFLGRTVKVTFSSAVLPSLNVTLAVYSLFPATAVEGSPLTHSALLMLSLTFLSVIPRYSLASTLFPALVRGSPTVVLTVFPLSLCCKESGLLTVTGIVTK